MRKCIAIGGAALGFLVLLGLQAGAQDGKRPPMEEPDRQTRPEPGPAPKVKRPPAEERDPTEPSPKLRDLLDAPKLVGPNAAPALPHIVLRGRIVTENQPPAVLLELDPKALPLTAGEGSELGYNGLRLKVIRITVNEVRIEIAGRSEVIVLR